MIFSIDNISTHSRSAYDSAFSTLPKWRQDRALSYKQEEDRRRSVFAFAMLQRLLANFPEAKDREIYADHSGRLHLEGDPLYLSMSHSGDFIACALDSSPIGIDIEALRTIDKGLVSRVCSREETFHVMGSELLLGENTERQLSAECSKRFLQVWTAKEAYLKYTGEGLSGGVKETEVATRRGMLHNLPTGEKLLSAKGTGFIMAVVSKE